MPPFNDSLLSMQRIAKTYPGWRCLRSLGLEPNVGEGHALIGESGAGKSTLTKIITGLIPADPGGTFKIQGEPIQDPTPSEIQVLGIAAVYQNPTLFSELSVMENLLMGEKRAVIRWRERRKTAQALLSRIGAPLDLDVPLKQLRMAEKQLLEIARSLARKARVLILREPTVSRP